MTAAKLKRDARIELTRKLVRATVAECESSGATAQEAAIGMIYATFDVAERIAGPNVLAIEWLRTTLDVLEGGIFEGKNQRGN